MSLAGETACAWCDAHAAQNRRLSRDLDELHSAYADMRAAWLAERAEAERLTKALAALQLEYRFEEARAERAERRVEELESEPPT